jgi:hypothetical protein
MRLELDAVLTEQLCRKIREIRLVLFLPRSET